MTETLTDLRTERRLLAALIAEPCVLAAADDVEEQDFSDLRHQVVLAAIRQLVADAADVDAGEIHDVIRIWDLEAEHGIRASKTHRLDSCGIWFLAELLISTEHYRGERVLYEHDMAWLRILADRRRNLRTSA